MPAGVLQAGDFTDLPAASGTVAYAIVTLQDPPVASYSGGIGDLQATTPAGRKLDPGSPTVAAYRSYLARTHDAYRGWLARSAPRAEIVREYFYVLNGFAIKLNGTPLGRLGQGPGARRVGFSWLYRPTMDVSPGLIGAPSLWSSLGGRPKQERGSR